MAHAYTPGLKVTPRIRHRVHRTLPIEGDVLVSVGDRVSARDVVARTLLPGDVRPVNVANALSMPAAEVPGAMLKEVGDAVAVGDKLARSKGMFGWFQSEYASKVEGTIENISGVTGQVIVRGEPLPVEVKAFLTGEVVEVLEREGCVIEADVSFAQGIFGIGGEAYGPLRTVVDDHATELDAGAITDDMAGQIIVGGGRMTGAAIRRAIEVGVAAVVSGGMDDQDLREVLGYDLGVAITGSESIGTTLIVTEGFGEIAMAGRTFDLLKAHEGADVAVNGATQIRAGVQRPEIVIPLGDEELAHQPEPEHSGGVLDLGMPVRLIRDPYFGIIGTVSELPSEPVALDSGSRARVLTVAVEGRELITVPRANVELIER